MILRAGLIIILQFFLVACRTHYIKQKQEYSHYDLKEKEQNARLGDSVASYKKVVDAETGRVIAKSEGELTKEGNESTLGNFVCDAMFYTGGEIFKGEKIDGIVVNRGGLRANLPLGEIKVINIFELMPFENEMVLLTVKGEVLKEVLPLILDKKHPFGGWKVKKDAGEYKMFFGGSALDLSQTYKILTSDYLVSGGDNFGFLAGALEVKPSGVKIRDAIIIYCESVEKARQRIKPYRDGRLELSK
jgi:2',3'-cyclic-nucleotide 2'-phosphodiesterase (5'-nucleotidase family)